MKKVLVISNDVVDQKMAGVGVRNWEIANALAVDCEVSLAIPNDSKLESPHVKLVKYDPEGGHLRELAGQVDALVLGGSTLHFHPYLRDLGVPMAVDLYVPNLLESLVWHEQDDLADWKPHYEEYLRVQLELLRAGDFFFCASERQRDYWIGFLHAQKRINPHTYSADHALRRLIDVVPYGLPEEPLPERRPVLKGLTPGIPENAFLILWNGGLWDWLDPLTLVRAMAMLENRLPQARLYFMGASHPDVRIQNVAMPEQTIRLSKELGLYDRTVFFGDWAPYAERGRYLQEADLSAVLYADHIETRFSFRTRLMDCMWAGLPVVTNGGDELSELMVKAGVGERVPYGDPAAVAEAIAARAAGKKSVSPEKVWEDLRRDFRWQYVTAPLMAFCQNPHLAEDKGQYLTDVERVTKDKDAFHEKVVKEKDDFLEKVVHDKDAFLEKVVHDKDAFLEKVVQDKDTFLEKVVQDKDTFLEKVVHDKDAFLEQVAKEKDADLAKAIAEREGLQVILDRYHRSLPFRTYYRMRKFLNGKT
jgi:glycosyltransferase involved in cell wall biosynthesis